jgi:hypothetical protein
MFTFMNTARIGTAIQGVAHAELSFQGALPYAQERRSMRSLSGKKEPDSGSRRLDLAPRCAAHAAHAKGDCRRRPGHGLCAAQIADKMFNAVQENDQAHYKKYDDKLGFYTPILKGFLTEMGLEAANLGMQVFGGHGYIGEHGMEQIARDARISTLYEGTTGIQALDLLGRKVLLLKPFALQRTPMGHMARTLARRTAQWNLLTTLIMLRASKDREQVGSSSVEAVLIARIYEVFPLLCPLCGGQMRLIVFITEGTRESGASSITSGSTRSRRTSPRHVGLHCGMTVVMRRWVTGLKLHWSTAFESQNPCHICPHAVEFPIRCPRRLS